MSNLKLVLGNEQKAVINLRGCAVYSFVCFGGRLLKGFVMSRLICQYIEDIKIVQISVKDRMSFH